MNYPDINNLPICQEVDEIDGSASAFDQAAPPPERDDKGTPIVYTIRVKPVENGVKEEKRVRTEDFPLGCVGQFTAREQVHYGMAIEYEIVSDNPRFNGRTARDYVSTMVMDSTSGVDTLLRFAVGQAGMGLGRYDKIKQLYDVLATAPLVRATTQWTLDATEARFDEKKGKDVYDTFLRGMRRFPSADINGVKVYRPLDADPQTGAPARTRWEVVKMFPAA